MTRQRIELLVGDRTAATVPWSGCSCSGWPWSPWSWACSPGRVAPYRACLRPARLPGGLRQVSLDPERLGVEVGGEPGDEARVVEVEQAHTGVRDRRAAGETAGAGPLQDPDLAVDDPAEVGADLVERGQVLLPESAGTRGPVELLLGLRAVQLDVVGED